jgi:hypothetical protein
LRPFSSVSEIVGESTIRIKSHYCLRVGCSNAT